MSESYTATSPWNRPLKMINQWIYWPWLTFWRLIDSHINNNKTLSLCSSGQSRSNQCNQRPCKGFCPKPKNKTKTLLWCGFITEPSPKNYLLHWNASYWNPWEDNSTTSSSLLSSVWFGSGGGFEISQGQKSSGDSFFFCLTYMLCDLRFSLCDYFQNISVMNKYHCHVYWWLNRLQGSNWLLEEIEIKLLAKLPTDPTKQWH